MVLLGFKPARWAGRRAAVCVCVLTVCDAEASLPAAAAPGCLARAWPTRSSVPELWLWMASSLPPCRISRPVLCSALKAEHQVRNSTFVYPGQRRRGWARPSAHVSAALPADDTMLGQPCCTSQLCRMHLRQAHRHWWLAVWLPAADEISVPGSATAFIALHSAMASVRALRRGGGGARARRCWAGHRGV